MMALLIPLGLLGLLSIAALILIYIIKPNYQQKIVSSTFVWKLSLKYRKKRIPISKLRNILLIICQVLILVACAMMLARPSMVYTTAVSDNEVVAIIDSSASMRAEMDEETRYERAVAGVKKLADGVLADGGIVSVIIAEEEGSFLADRVTEAGKAGLMDELDKLVSDLDKLSCSYSYSDIDNALSLCEEVLSENPTAKIFVYTDNTYLFVPEGVSIVDVKKEQEWNAAILDAYTELDDGYYSVIVDTACYGIDTTFDVHVEVNGANTDDKNDTGTSISFSQSVTCSGDKPVTVIFRNGDKALEDYETESDRVVFYDIVATDLFRSYKSINITLDVVDSLAVDNTFDIYGGQKEVIKIQYASSDPNRFLNGAISMIQLRYGDRWDIQYDEVDKNKEPQTEGYDFYIFEHRMPKELPTDGVVFLTDLNSAPAGSNLRVDGNYDLSNTGMSFTLNLENEHKILNKIVPDDITVSKFNVISDYDPAYEVLMACENNPVMLVKNQGDAKIIVTAFSLHFSNLALLPAFPRLFINIFDYFFPATVSGYAFEVNEEITLNSMSSELYCSGIEQPFTEFPAKMSFSIPGTYTFSQTTDFGKFVSEQVFVKIPSDESNIVKVVDGLTSPYKQSAETQKIDDLLLYFAIALVTLLFIEWLLQAKENF